MTDTIGVLSIFKTIDGEVNVWGQGGWTIFVRTRGCTVGCHWCDTKYSWSNKGGMNLQPLELIDHIRKVGGNVRKITLTGGEPLEQSWTALYHFIKLLVAYRYNVTVETSGTENTIHFRKGLASAYPSLTLGIGQLTFVVDYKLASSKFIGKMDLNNHFRLLQRGDYIKFVIDSAEDFEQAADVVWWLHKQKSCQARMYFSPCHDSMPAAALLDKMLDKELDQMGVGLNIQAHKYIWTDDVRTEENLGIDSTKRSLGREVWLTSMKELK